MEKISLSENVKVTTVSETATQGTFDIEGLYRGYGLTLGNAIRRVLLSSLPGAAITQVKIKGVSHEFSTIPGVVEDVVEIMLNLKRLRFQYNNPMDEYGAPEIVMLKKKGEGPVTASDIEGTNLIQVINKEAPIATISEKGTELEMELTVEKGLGYVPVESSKTVTLPVGVIKLDALFSPVTRVNFTVENMRVGEFTDFNKLRLVIDTSGAISPSAALKKALGILQEHFAKTVDMVQAVEVPVATSGEEKKPVKKRASKKKAEEVAEEAPAEEKAPE